MKSVYIPLLLYFRTAILKAASYGPVRTWYGMEHGSSLAGTFSQRAGLAGTYFAVFPRYEPVFGEMLCTQCSR